MNSFTAHLDVSMLEFLLDLPSDMKIKDVTIQGSSVKFVINTPADITKPVVNLTYKNNEGVFYLDGIE